MLARILPILALLVLCVLGYWLYSQGTIQQILRPTVTAVEVKRQLIQGQKIRESFIDMREMPLTAIEPGMITFPAGTTTAQVEQAFAAVNVSRNVDRGSVLRSNMLGRSSGVVVLRSSQEIVEGDNLSLVNIAASSLSITPPTGAIVFESEEEATLYISRTYDLMAKRSLPAGQVLTVEDISGGVGNVFVVRLSRPYARSERLSLSGLEVTDTSTRDLPSGAIAFQTRGAADVFIASSGRYLTSRSAGRGEIITADLISSESGEAPAAGDDTLPRTLSELISYMRAYPDRAMMLETGTFTGLQPARRDMEVDIWVEESRTGGAFGQINLVRIASGLTVLEAFDTGPAPTPNEDQAMQDTQVPADGAAGGTTAENALTMNPAQDQGATRAVIGEQTDRVSPPGEEAEPREYLWVQMDPEVKKIFDATKGQGRIAFAITNRDIMVDVLGNGASCRDDRCQINRAASEDLAALVEALSPEVDESDESGAEIPDPLTVLDGVGPALERKLRENGYDSFESIAAWTDGEIPAVTIKHDISTNLAVYIRKQAEILVSSAEAASRELGFDQPPEN